LAEQFSTGGPVLRDSRHWRYRQLLPCRSSRTDLNIDKSAKYFRRSGMRISFELLNGSIFRPIRNAIGILSEQAMRLRQEGNFMSGRGNGISASHFIKSRRISLTPAGRRLRAIKAFVNEGIVP
jgi:hypothetical protein